MEIKNLTEQNFDEFINQEYALVDFYATWCGPCKMMHPVLENVLQSRSNTMIAKVDVDNNANLAKRYGVMSIPTLILFKNGKVIDQKTGYMPEPLLIEWINENE